MRRRGRRRGPALPWAPRRLLCLQPLPRPHLRPIEIDQARQPRDRRRTRLARPQPGEQRHQSTEPHHLDPGHTGPPCPSSSSRSPRSFLLLRRRRRLLGAACSRAERDQRHLRGSGGVHLSGVPGTAWRAVGWWSVGGERGVVSVMWWCSGARGGAWSGERGVVVQWSARWHVEW